jgi:hypothetical protein
MCNKPKIWLPSQGRKPYQTFSRVIREWDPRPKVSREAPSIDSAISRSRPGVGGEERRATRSLRLAELAEHGVDRVERRVYLLPHLHTRTETLVWAMQASSSPRTTSHLCTSENNLSRDKDEEYDFGFDHSINKAREQL